MDFGSQILELMFEMCDESTASYVGRPRLEVSVEYNEPRVNLEDVVVQAHPELGMSLRLRSSMLIVGS